MFSRRQIDTEIHRNIAIFGRCFVAGSTSLSTLQGISSVEDAKKVLFCMKEFKNCPHVEKFVHHVEIVLLFY